MLQAGIVGLPNVGKSTLFNALTAQEAALAANYPFATIEPNVGVVEVPDERLAVLQKLNNAQKIVPATVEFLTSRVWFAVRQRRRTGQPVSGQYSRDACGDTGRKML